jgi:sigma-E factor negative regulatory protein RseA
MSNQLRDNSERISALVDGQLEGEELALALADLASQPQARTAWDNYQLVGQLMRASDTPLRPHDPAFVDRLMRGLVQPAEPAITVAPLPASRPLANSPPVGAANDAWWTRVVGLASVALVAVLAWQAAPRTPPEQSAQTLQARDQQLAQARNQQLAPAPSQPQQAAASTMLVTVDGASALMIRNPQLDALLATQHPTGGVTSLYMSAGFSRNASFDEERR